MRRRPSEEFAERFGAPGKGAGKTTKKKRKEAAKCGELQEKQNTTCGGEVQRKKKCNSGKKYLRKRTISLDKKCSQSKMWRKVVRSGKR